MNINKRASLLSVAKNVLRSKDFKNVHLTRYNIDDTNSFYMPLVRSFRLPEKVINVSKGSPYLGEKNEPIKIFLHEAGHATGSRGLRMPITRTSFAREKLKEELRANEQARRIILKSGGNKEQIDSYNKYVKPAYSSYKIDLVRDASEKKYPFHSIVEGIVKKPKIKALESQAFDAYDRGKISVTTAQRLMSRFAGEHDPQFLKRKKLIEKKLRPFLQKESSLNDELDMVKKAAFLDELSKLAGGDDFLAMDPVKPSMPNAAATPTAKPRLPTFNDTQVGAENPDRSYGQSYTPNGADEGQE